MNYEGKRGDLLLPQGTFIYIQDGSSGQVQIAVGPHKESIGEMDKLVVYNASTKKFIPRTQFEDAIQVTCSADENQYIVLDNPANPKEDEHKFPTKGRNPNMPSLSVGNKINTSGPATFPLWPGQVGKVVDGHNLKYNEYLLVRVYNEEQAKANLSKAVVKTIDGQKKPLIAEEDLITGKLLVIKGTEVSFYIPPTGIEVLFDNGSYIRQAVTLERLEYCILLDQNGDKRYVKGPDVVFPKPTEEFLEQEHKKKFRALELNNNMGIYVKVIADYTENGKEYKTGEELFIIGKKQKIYFPREEHAIVKYDNQIMNYSVAITEGEARYVLNKETGQVKTLVGPKMFLPDPRHEVLVKRILDEKTVELWFPGSEDALEYNRGLEQEDQDEDIFGNFRGGGMTLSNRSMRSTGAAYASAALGDTMKRKGSFTKPRTLTMDNKYEGAVTINVWPGYAIQVVKKTGEREVITGPKVKLLSFDETLEVLNLSTGKPKNDHDLLKTVYLQTENNVVSDIITTETSDLVNVDIRLSYRVNFQGDNKKWFNVSDYIKLMTQHLRSIVRNKVKKINIEDFNNNAADILRDIVLGTAEEGKKRSGKTFTENGMHVYDIEILDIKIGDSDIAYNMKEYQRNVVKKNLEINRLKRDLEDTKKKEEIKRKILNEEFITEQTRSGITLQRVKADDLITKKKGIYAEENQRVEDNITKMVLEVRKLEADQKLSEDREGSLIRTQEYEKQMAAIQPKLIEALITIGGVKTTKILAENLKQQGGDWTDIFRKGGIDGLLDSIKGTPLYDNIIQAIGKDV